MGVSGGSNGVAYDVTYSFFLNGANNTLSTGTNAVLWSPTFNGLTATNFGVLSSMLLTVNGVIITNQVSGKVYDFGDINTGNTIASWADVTNIVRNNTSGGGGTNGGVPALAGTNMVIYAKNGSNVFNGVTDTNVVNILIANSGVGGGTPALAGSNMVIYLKNGSNIFNGVTDTNAVNGLVGGLVNSNVNAAIPRGDSSDCAISSRAICWSNTGLPGSI